MALVVATPPERWVRRETVDRCELCRLDFGIARRKHHCRLCGHVFCGQCSDFWAPPLAPPGSEPSGSREGGQEGLERRCRRCYEAYTRSEKERAAQAVRAAAATAAAERTADQLALTQRHTRMARIEAGVIDTGRSFAHGLPSIGRRAHSEKSYFLCRQPSDGVDSQELLLALVKPQRRNLRMADELREFILGLQHPFVMPVVDLMFFPETMAREEGDSTISLGVFRSVAAWGSLRDVLHSGADPALPIAEKYAAARRLGSPLPQDRLSLYGRQILEGIVFLQSVWVSCAGVTTSNVLVLSDDWCVITDWENDLLGMRSSSTRHDWLATRPHPAVYAFGHILYEMSTGGTPLLSNTLPSTLQASVPVPVLQVLDTIFNYPIGDKFEALEIASLLALPFFDTVLLRDRHLRLLITPSASTAAQRQLLSECGFVPNPTAKKEERAARRRARDYSREIKANQRYSKQLRRNDRTARRMRHQARKNERAAKRSGQVVTGGIAQGHGQALHCVEFQSAEPLGLEVESILPGRKAGHYRTRNGSGDVTVVDVESGGQADRLAVQVGMMLLTVSGVSVIDPSSGMPRSVGEVLAMVNAARQTSPKLMIEFAYPPPPAAEDIVVLLDPTEPLGLELTDAVQPGEEDGQWKVRCVAVVPGSQADDYGLKLPCVLTCVGGRSVADRGFDYVLSVIELAKTQAVDSETSFELRFQTMPERRQWVTEPANGSPAGFKAKMDDVTRHVFVNTEPLGVELADVKGDVRAIAIHPGGQGDLLGVPQDRVLATVQDEAVLGLSFVEIVAKIQEAKSKKSPLILGFQAAIGVDPILAAISSDPSSSLDVFEATAPKAKLQRVVSGFALSIRETLGLELEESPADEALKVQVVGCVPKSTADRFGVACGSLIAAVQGEPCDGLDFEQVVAKLSAAKAGTDALFGIAGFVCIQFLSPLVKLAPRPRADDGNTDELGQVAAWLHSIGMQRHCDVFEENAITEMVLMEELGEPQLKEMGLGALERRMMLRAIRDWSQMGREEAKQAAAAATAAQILKLHRENAELRAKLSTADSKARWAEEQAAQLEAVRAQRIVEQQPATLTKPKKTKTKKPKNVIEKRPPVREPRLDGSRRRDEVADALDAQEQASADAAPRTKRNSKEVDKADRQRHARGKESTQPVSVAKPKVDDSWLDDTVSESEPEEDDNWLDDTNSGSESSASKSMTSEPAQSLSKSRNSGRKGKSTVAAEGSTDEQKTSLTYTRPKSLRPSIFEDDFQDSDDTTEDEAEEIVGWGDRSRRESAQSIGESSVHSSLFGGSDTDTSIASSAPFGADSASDAESVLSTNSDALHKNDGTVPTLKGSNLNAANGLAMPKFGLRGDDAGMFDLASDDDSDDESLPSSFASFGKPSTGRPVDTAGAARARATLFGGDTPGTLFKDD